MSIRTQIDRIVTARDYIAAAIMAKGVSVPSGAKIDDMPDLIGSIPEKTDPALQAKTVSPATSAQTVKPDSGYDGLSQVMVNAMPTATQATPTISFSTAGLITATATQAAGYVTAGTKNATKQLPIQAAQTITPGTSNKTIASGIYLTGTQTIKGDSNLVAENIKSGVSIFGVNGSYEGSAGGNFYTTEVTLASAHSTQTYKTICTIPFIKENYNNQNLFVMLLRKDTSEITYSIPIVIGCNNKYLFGAYVLAIKKTSYGQSMSLDSANQLYTNSANSFPRLRVWETGVIQIISETSYSFSAGTYSVIYGIL